MRPELKKSSKFLSLVLRHSPETIGLSLDANGWARIDDLLRKLRRSGHTVTAEDLQEIVETNDKKRFTISDDGKRIRAAQGHTINVDLALEPTQPPSLLYHGTATANLDAIFSEGLKPGKRQHVHLSLDPDTAMGVGRRHGKAIVLKVDADAMQTAGFAFYKADNGVWLTEHVPAQYLSFADNVAASLVLCGARR